MSPGTLPVPVPTASDSFLPAAAPEAPGARPGPGHTGSGRSVHETQAPRLQPPLSLRVRTVPPGGGTSPPSTLTALRDGACHPSAPGKARGSLSPWHRLSCHWGRGVDPVTSQGGRGEERSGEGEKTPLQGGPRPRADGRTRSLSPSSAQGVKHRLGLLLHKPDPQARGSSRGGKDGAGTCLVTCRR